MSESLTERLRSLGVQLGTGQMATRPRSQRAEHGIQGVVDGLWRETSFGPVFQVEQAYSGDYLHGTYPVHPPQSFSTLCQWSRAQKLLPDAAGDVIFLDTETTGLMGGTGTIVFLVGLGYWTTEGGFKLVQLFLEQPASEAAMIAALGELLHPFKALVTYNGKSFDIPLLTTRHILNGFTPPFGDYDHLDLLPLARRLWRNRLPSRSLGYVEQEVLAVRRGQEEIPGWMIPDIYSGYLRSGDARPLAGVFYHNAVDILSLAGVFTYVARLLEDPTGCDCPHSLDIMAVAQLHEDLGDLVTADRCYSLAVQMGLPEGHDVAAVMRHAHMYRSQEDWYKAVDLWERAAEARSVDAMVELAKFYEHRLRDYARAMDWTHRAIQLLPELRLNRWELQNRRAELEHRQARLEMRKIRLDGRSGT